MGYDDRFYDRGISRNNSQDAVSRVASEIFHHDLQQASMDTRSILSQCSGRDAQGFVSQVNRQLAEMNRYSGQDYGNQSYGDNQPSNYLSARQSYDRNGQIVERVSMVSSDGMHQRGIAEIPTQPYGRVPMNFNPYQPGERQGANYYDNQSQYRPQQPVNYNYDSDSSYSYPPQYTGYSPGYNTGYNPGYYHRPYAYGGYPNYQGYQGGGSLAAGLLIGAVASRVFHF